MGIEIKKYSSNYFADCMLIFKSNVPKYFGENEVVLFEKFLQKDIERFTYYVILDDNLVVGCGGYCFDEETKEHILCWGMVHADKHKKGYGEQLLKFRLEEIKNLGGKIVVSNTAQYTDQFFAKYGFKLEKIEHDHWFKGLHLYKMVLEIA